MREIQRGRERGDRERMKEREREREREREKEQMALIMMHEINRTPHYPSPYIF